MVFALHFYTVVLRSHAVTSLFTSSSSIPIACVAVVHVISVILPGPLLSGVCTSIGPSSCGYPCRCHDMTVLFRCCRLPRVLISVGLRPSGPRVILSASPYARIVDCQYRSPTWVYHPIVRKFVGSCRTRRPGHGPGMIRAWGRPHSPVEYRCRSTNQNRFLRHVLCPSHLQVLPLQVSHPSPSAPTSEHSLTHSDVFSSFFSRFLAPRGVLVLPPHSLCWRRHWTGPSSLCNDLELLAPRQRRAL